MREAEIKPRRPCRPIAPQRGHGINHLNEQVKLHRLHFAIYLFEEMLAGHNNMMLEALNCMKLISK